ncbi:AT-hook motif nuclear-localized protein 28-like [Neltuma alba]|uniref:AT-hook motif nuclear-localized protein 28-like n=1 Tax=Neltuma alba TaxID=207710 RepID=UPI0010A5290A|nr:AT-hook motif nuclear-localized protein 28-like [Prosopis alba]
MDGDYSSFVASRTQTSSPGATVEVAKKHRGRPKGSKNKPKAARPLVPRNDMMAPYVLEVPHGNDVVRAISQFSLHKSTGLCILTASGAVVNASLCVSSVASAPDITCRGYHVILSMSAAFSPHQSLTSNYPPKPLTVSLAAPNGNVIGGLVSGSLVSAGPVYVIATPFNSPSYHKLSYEDEENGQNTTTGEGESGYAPSPLRGGIPVYSGNQAAVHGFWASVIRPPQPAPSTPPQYSFIGGNSIRGTVEY